MESYIRVKQVFGEQADKLTYLLSHGYNLGFHRKSVEGRSVVVIVAQKEGAMRPSREMVDLEFAELPDGWEEEL